MSVYARTFWCVHVWVITFFLLFFWQIEYRNTHHFHYRIRIVVHLVTSEFDYQLAVHDFEFEVCTLHVVRSLNRNRIFEVLLNAVMQLPDSIVDRFSVIERVCQSLVDEVPGMDDVYRWNVFG